MPQINVDHNKYIVCQNKQGEYFAAIDVKHRITMDNYSRNYDKFKSAPDDLTIEGYLLVPDQQPDSLRIDFNRKIQIPVNELRFSWIRIIR